MAIIDIVVAPASRHDKYTMKIWGIDDLVSRESPSISILRIGDAAPAHEDSMAYGITLRHFTLMQRRLRGESMSRHLLFLGVACLAPVTAVEAR